MFSITGGCIVHMLAKFLTELKTTSFTNCELGSGDVKVTVASGDGFRV
ncbi:hypothetical protein SLEP1_g617 [Rubroshorea leprosula]|uniref:Uncharacterized protein n=1 Tax=Rubroshorea leprosula TaxID=152421 RepID=A0AAV5HKI8_9ROSI|nr:hypothetical protein SLEP1_g617 [Rubroshorea leprosula]